MKQNMSFIYWTKHATKNNILESQRGHFITTGTE